MVSYLSKSRLNRVASVWVKGSSLHDKSKAENFKSNLHNFFSGCSLYKMAVSCVRWVLILTEPFQMLVWWCEVVSFAGGHYYCSVKMAVLCNAVLHVLGTTAKQNVELTRLLWGRWLVGGCE